jgi:hypothetical protein
MVKPIDKKQFVETFRMAADALMPVATMLSRDGNDEVMSGALLLLELAHDFERSAVTLCTENS